MVRNPLPLLVAVGLAALVLSPALPPREGTGSRPISIEGAGQSSQDAAFVPSLAARLGGLRGEETLTDSARREAALALIAAHLAARGTDAGGPVRALLEQEARNVASAQEFLRIIDEGRAADLNTSVPLAHAGTRWQVETLVQGWVEHAAPPLHANPSLALAELGGRFGVVATPDQLARLQSLDALPLAQRLALTRTVDAFLVYDAAAREAYGYPDGAWAVAARQSIVPPDARDNLLARVFQARLGLLDAAVDLKKVVDAQGPDMASLWPTVRVPPAFAIELGPFDANTYDANEPYAFLLDVGGGDTYLNNAGGNNLFFGGDPCSLVRYPAAALIDLGGADTYGSPSDPKWCGVNGGGQLGAGFLLDAGLEGDVYSALGIGANGGGANGAGFLFDAAGDDDYVAGGSGTNGGGAGGSFRGFGFLLDGGGGDTYDATLSGAGTNGGGIAGVGLLLDVAGTDAYDASAGGTNGGGASAGVGFLFDGGGDDDYTASYGGTNGGADSLSVGFLVDAEGSDDFLGSHHGSNGGSAFTAAGLLVNFFGVDSYTATGWFSYGAALRGANGGVEAVSPSVGHGLLVDFGGTGDCYKEDDDGEGDPDNVSFTFCDMIGFPKGVQGMQLDV